MKKLSLVLAVLLALTMLPAVCALAAGQEVIQNGDFELVGADGFAAGWTRNSDTYISVKTMADASGNADNKVVAFVKPESGQNIKFTTDMDNFPIDPSKEYVLSFDGNRTAGASKFNIMVYFRNDEGEKIKDGAGSDIYWSQTSVNPTKDAWLHYEFSVTGIPETTRIFEITFQNSQNVSASTSAAELYLDNISLKTELADGDNTEDDTEDDTEDVTVNTKNLIQNGDFELVGADEFATGWTRNADTYVSIKSVSGVDGQATNVAAFVKPEAKQNIKFTSNVNFSTIDPTKDYVLTFDGFKTAGASKFNVTIYYRDENGEKVKDDSNADIYWSKTSQDATKNAWKHFELIVTGIPAEARIFELTFQNSQNVSTSTSAAELYLDNISLEPAESKVTYTNGEGDAAGTIAVSYGAFLPSSYAEETAPSIVAIAALYKTDGSAKNLVSFNISDATALTKGAYTTIDLDSFDIPTQDADKYSIRVFSVESASMLKAFETLPAQALATPAA